jgi:FkbM family methyltransferase
MLEDGRTAYGDDMPAENLIFDIGMHKGEDTDFYLKKGFRVIGVEANPVLSEYCIQRFQNACQTGQLVVVSKAVAEHGGGTVDFYVNKRFSIWGTADRDWMVRNQKLGAESDVIQVPSVRMDDLLSQYGIPYYMKVDIEGLDHVCISTLVSQTDKPSYVSVETHAYSYAETLKLLTLLSAAGYTRFKIVSQTGVANQICPHPAREGAYVDARFPADASGLFAKELPGRWLTLAEAKSQFRRIYRIIRFLGPHYGVLRIFKNHYTIAALARRFPAADDWFDIHATL